jgi:hypothetical protein
MLETKTGESESAGSKNVTATKYNRHSAKYNNPTNALLYNKTLI